MNHTVSTDKAPQAIGPYSQAVISQGFVFLSGQIPLTAGGELVTGDITAQTEQVFHNISTVLSGLGLGFQNVVKTTVFLSSMDHFAAMNAVYATKFTAPFPARSTVAVAGLPNFRRLVFCSSGRNPVQPHGLLMALRAHVDSRTAAADLFADLLQLGFALDDKSTNRRPVARNLEPGTCLIPRDEGRYFLFRNRVGL